MKKLPLLLILLSVLQGCISIDSICHMDIEVMKPGYFNLSPDYRNAGILYNNSSYQMDSALTAYNFKNQILYDSINYDSLASLTYFNSFEENLKLLNRFDTVINLGYLYPDVGKNNITFLSKNQCDSLKQNKGIDIIFSLNSYHLTDEINLLKNYYLSEVKVKSNAIWTVYDLNSDKDIQAVFKADSVTFESSKISKRALNRTKEERLYFLEEASVGFGADMVKYMLPFWESVERNYYCPINYKFVEAKNYISTNNWIEAAKIWKGFTKSKRRPVKAMSMYNMALACEMEGDLDAAIDWVIKSFYEFRDINTIYQYNPMEYLNKLNRRKLEIKKLDTGY